VGHYSDEQPVVGSSIESVDVALTDVGFTMLTDRGVFSRGHLDTGTAFLLRGSPAPATTGDLLDLGCGTGAIALTMALRSPEATVWAIDVNDRARELTRLNAERNAITNIRVASPDEVPDSIRFATIWSNPPIRIGKRALHDLLLSWLAQLDDDGEAILVVQKHLGADSLQRWLVDAGFPTERRASRGGFRLLRTGPPVRR
jgi:16S rRNA G1207 methylase RsmC